MNAVDVTMFSPAASPPADGPVLLLGGDQTQRYRLELALDTLAVLRRTHAEARLLVTGRLESPAEPLIHDLELQDHVFLLGEYAQRDAPSIFRRAHVLLHTKVEDPCPTLVLEAMASGLPVVYPASGGTVELVGDEAGIGVPHPDTWERDEPPSARRWPMPWTASSPTFRGMRKRPGRASWSGSRSSRGSRVARRSSRSSPRSSRAPVRAASQRGTRPSPCCAGRARRQCPHGTDRHAGECPRRVGVLAE